MTAWQADDLAWFRTHPPRSHRARRPFPGEWWPAVSPSLEARVTIVRQTAPGRHEHLLATIPADDLVTNGELPESLCASIFDNAAIALECGEALCSRGAVIDWAHKLEEAGNA